jgi:hypothetical protein
VISPQRKWALAKFKSIGRHSPMKHYGIEEPLADIEKIATATDKHD